MQATVARLVGERRLVALSRTYLDTFGQQLRGGSLRRTSFMLAKYLLELTLPEASFLRYSPLVVALSAMRLAAHTMDKAPPARGQPRLPPTQLADVDHHFEASHCFVAAPGAGSDYAPGSSYLRVAANGSSGGDVVRASVDECVSELRLLHKDVSNRRVKRGQPEKLRAIYDRYGGAVGMIRFDGTLNTGLTSRGPSVIFPLPFSFIWRIPIGTRNASGE